jgi:hypothetical protein
LSRCRSSSLRWASSVALTRSARRSVAAPSEGSTVGLSTSVAARWQSRSVTTVGNTVHSEDMTGGLIGSTTRPNPGPQATAFPQVRLGGAAGDRTQDRRIMRGTAGRPEQPACTDRPIDSAGMRRMHTVSRAVVPRLVPRLPIGPATESRCPSRSHPRNDHPVDVPPPRAPRTQSSPLSSFSVSAAKTALRSSTNFGSCSVAVVCKICTSIDQ